MSRRTWLGRAVGLAVGAAIVGAFAPAAVALVSPKAAAGDPPSVSEDFGGCIAGGGTADILLLVDESGSLQESDPDLARVTSATYFLTQLAGMVDDGGAAVNVQLSVFGHEYSTVQGWTSFSGETLEPMLASVATLADRTDGFDTDYWTALVGARGDLATQAASRGEETSCQALVWFTDGKLDYEIRDSAAEEEKYGTQKVFAPGVEITSVDGSRAAYDAAVEDLCRGEGIADQARSSGITMFGVGLNGSTSKPEDFDFFSSIVAGTSASGGSTCGDLIEPPRGEFYLATDIDSLLFAFDAIATDGGGSPIEQETGICQTVACVDQSHRFVLDGSTPDVRILASADIGGLDVTVQLPQGETVALVDQGVGVPSTATAQGVEFAYTWLSDRTVSVDITRANATAEAWTGLWQLAFTDPAGQSADKKSKSSIHISTSIRPAWLNGDGVELRSGETVDGAVFGLVDANGAVIDPQTILGSLDYSVVLQDQSGASTVLVDADDPAEVAVPVDIDLSDAEIGPAIITMTLGLTTAPVTLADGTLVEGTQLAPSTVGLRTTILPPARYPTLAKSVDFGEATGAAQLTGTLAVEGDGCAWLATDAKADVVASPADIGAVAITSASNSEDDCQEAGELTLTLTTEAAGNGAINGTIPVMIGAADGAGEPLVVEVAFTASLLKPLNQTSFWLTLVLALILGPGIPLLLLYLAKWVVAKIPPRSLAASLVPIRVEAGRVLRSGERFAILPEDLRNTVAIDARGSRRLEVPGGTLRATSGWSPLGQGYVQFESPGNVGASSATPATDRSGTRARLPLAVHGSWVVLHTPGASEQDAAVLVLVGGDANAAERDRLAEDVNRRLPDVLAALTAAEPETPGGGDSPGGFSEPSSPFAGAGVPASGFSGFAAGGTDGSPFGQAPAPSPTPPPATGAPAPRVVPPSADPPPEQSPSPFGLG